MSTDGDFFGVSHAFQVPLLYVSQNLELAGFSDGSWQTRLCEI